MAEFEQMIERVNAPDMQSHIDNALEAASIYYRDAIRPRENPRSKARTYGAQWREALRLAWYRASYPSALSEHSGMLQRIRNSRIGYLDKFVASWEK